MVPKFSIGETGSVTIEQFGAFISVVVLAAADQYAGRRHKAL